MQLVDCAVAWCRLGGVEGAVEAARERRGGHLDPHLVDRFCALAPVVLPELDATPTWDALIEAEPALRPTLDGEELDAALEAVADFADLKSPYFTGHSRGVAALVEAAAPRCGLPNGEAVKVRRAALIQCAGRRGCRRALRGRRGVHRTRGRVQGARGDRRLLARVEAFPDMRGRDDLKAEAGDTAFNEWIFGGTHSGPFETPEGTIPATGKRVTLRGCDLVAVRDGRIYEQRAYDQLSLMTQLGLVPEGAVAS